VPERIPIPAARVLDVANAAHVCPRTVQKYRDGLHVLDVVEIAITKAARELPADAQLELGAVTTRINRSGVSPTMGQPGEIRSCPGSSTDCTSATRPTPAGRSASIPPAMTITVGGFPIPVIVDPRLTSYDPPYILGTFEPATTPPPKFPKRLTVIIDGRAMTVEELAQYEARP